MTIVLLLLAAASLSLAGFYQYRQDPRTVTNLEEIARLDRAASGLKEWQHGYETRFVRATRYKNPHIGQNIGFVFPGNEHKCDRKELVDFMSNEGGEVYQCGGYPGAEMLVIFKGVTDRDSANAKLVQLMPKLDRFIRSLK